MSKKDQFKKLLGDSGTTGSDQKNRILNDTLISGNNSLPPVSEEIKHSSADPVVSTINPAEEQPVQVQAVQQQQQPVQQPEQPSVQEYQQPLEQVPVKEEIHQESQEVKLSNEQAIAPPPQASVGNGISSIISSLSNTVDLKVEETHTRKTYLIENELLAELDKLCVGKKKGYKTKMINSGLRIVLELVNQNKEFKL
ncbi:hypothetical protein [Paenibacillus illinoisensis]|uniref:hypothetical protein n=1 Tax=Paenibacillus illinoisensis TaxID=59845 RepID=UPI001C8E6EB8|nr:hypothetical protein [Paenibacillus illinoisensis]MBY0217941.1 hypothetical protein [Paenibacillus illinoisensis]